MTLRHIAHHLTCPDCAAALQGSPPEGPAADRCALILDEDQDPAVRCPHPRDGDSEWCEVHAEAVGELAIAAEADVLAQAIDDRKRAIATARMGLWAADRILAGLRSRGAPAAEIAGLKMQRNEAAAEIERTVARKAELEARLAVLRPPAIEG